MPPRSPEIPTYFERLVLGKIRNHHPIEKDVPAMQKTVSKLLAKGWIEDLADSTLALTDAGEKALKAKIPLHR
jgi:hypothetical protein